MFREKKFKVETGVSGVRYWGGWGGPVWARSKGRANRYGTASMPIRARANFFTFSSPDPFLGSASLPRLFLTKVPFHSQCRLLGGRHPTEGAIFFKTHSNKRTLKIKLKIIEMIKLISYII